MALWRHGNCRGVVSDSNVAVTVGMMSPAMVAICMMQGSGVGLDVCFSLSEGKRGNQRQGGE